MIIQYSFVNSNYVLILSHNSSIRNIQFLGFCKKATYNVGIQSFDRKSFINIENNDKDNSRAILIYYSTAAIKVSTTSSLISLSSFISSIGGNLGLFVGFSFLSVFLLIYKFISRALYRRKKETFIFERIFLWWINISEIFNIKMNKVHNFKIDKM